MVNKLNFGCGKKSKKNWDNADIQPEAPISFDFDKFPYPLKKNHYDYILVRQVLNYLENPAAVLEELWKASRLNAIIEIDVPDRSNVGAYNDLRVKHYFCWQTFKRFVDEPYTVSKKEMFEIAEIYVTPTSVGRFIPKKLRDKFSLFFGGLHSRINVKLRVINK